MFLNNPPAPFSISPISSWHLLALDGHINLITNCKDHWSCTSIYQVWSPICSSRCKSQDHPHGHITDHLLAKFTTFSLLRDGSQNSLDLLPNGQIHSTFTSWDAMIVVSDPAPTDLVKIRNYIRFFNCSKWCRISSIHHPSRPQKMNQKYSKLVRTRWSQNPKAKTEGTRIISHHSETGEKLILKVVSWGTSTSIVCDFKISIKWPNMAQLELPQPFPAW